MNKLCSIVGLAILWTLLPNASLAEDAQNTLTSVSKALGSENLKMLHYSGTGSSYVVTQGRDPAGGWPHSVMKSYVRDLNLEATASRLELVRAEGTPPSDNTISHVIDANSP